MCPGHFQFMLDGKVGVPSLENDTVTEYIPLYVFSHLFQPHTVNNGLTDIEDVVIHMSCYQCKRMLLAYHTYTSILMLSAYSSIHCNSIQHFYSGLLKSHRICGWITLAESTPFTIQCIHFRPQHKTIFNCTLQVFWCYAITINLPRHMWILIVLFIDPYT